MSAGRLRIAVTCGLLLWTLTATVAAPCATQETEVPTIHHSADDLAELPRWTVGEADLTIGRVRGPEEYQLHQVTGARMLSNGTLAVVSFGSAEVLFYDDEGRFLHRIGGKGRGPGEFLQLTKLYELGRDSILTWDVAQARGPVFDLEGKYGRQVTPPPGISRAVVSGVFADGSMLLSRGGFQGTPTDRSYVRTLYRLSRNGGQVDTLGTFPGPEMVRPEELGHGTNVTFSPATQTATAGRSYWVGTGREPILHRYDLEGRATLRVTWDAGDRRITSEEIEAHWRRELERWNGERADYVRRRREHVPVADRFPTIGPLKADEVGYVWVQEYPRPSFGEVKRWRVLSTDGRFIARVELPGDFVLTEIGKDYVLGITRDEVGVQRVVRRPLVRR